VTGNLSVAMQYLQTGRLREAEMTCRQILQSEPSNAHALHLLGVVAGQAGRHDVAADLFRRAVAIQPAVADFRRNLGLALEAQGQLRDAADAVRAALHLKPDDPLAHYSLGNVCVKQGEHQAAVDCYREALRLKPDFPMAHHNMATALREQGNVEGAIEHFRLAIEQNPHAPGSYNDLAGVLLDRGDFREAIECLQEVLRRNPNSAGAYNNIGVALQAKGQVEQAITCYQSALQLQDDFVEAQYNLAVLLATNRDVEAAATAFQRLAEISPDHPGVVAGRARILEIQGKVDEAYQLLKPEWETRSTDPKVVTTYATICKEVGQQEEAASALRKLVSDPALPACHRIPAGFVLGDIYDSLSRHDQAFECYHEANMLRTKSCPFDPRRHAKNVQRLIASFGAEQLERLARVDSDSQLPVFIVGMPRSGTSLVEQILASHPRVFGGGELADIPELVASVAAAPAESTVSGPAADGSPVQIVESDPYQFQHVLENLDGLTANDLGDLAERYVQRLRSLSADALRVTDKLPGNYQHLGFLKVLFPKARIIHCVRHPLDTCLSCYFQNFLRGHYYSYDLTHLGLFYRDYEQLMRHWRDNIEVPLLDIRYEELVADLPTHARRLVEYCGLEWDERCLRFYESDRLVKTASYQQVRQPIYTRSVARWRNYEKHLVPLKDALAGPGQPA
jgi:tetratricopeptide (TPR) repeat protein